MPKTFHLITFGCQMNFNDSERINGLLNQFLRFASKQNQADLVILNTCGVRQTAEDRVIGTVKNIQKANPHTHFIITGCLANREDVSKKFKKFAEKLKKKNHATPLKIDFVEILALPDFLKKSLKKPKIEKDYAKKNHADFFKIKPLYSNSFSASVPIMTGCNNFCTYCVVPYARGREFSRPPAEIIQEVRQLVKKGVKEIILLGQNVNSYRPPISKQITKLKTNSRQTPPIANFSKIAHTSESINDFPSLLNALAQIPGDFWLRFITSHPKDMSPALIKTIAKHPKITNYIHLPFQAGSNKILKKMNRRYTREHYLNLIEQIKNALPQAAISTDIIVGFPEETPKDFEKTKEIMNQVGFSMAYISKYSPRPGTAAFSLKDNVPYPEKTQRKEALTEILRKSAKKINQAYLGQTIRVLIEKNPKNLVYWGKTEQYVKVNIIAKNNAEIKIGDFALIKITRANDFGLEGVPAGR